MSFVQGILVSLLSLLSLYRAGNMCGVPLAYSFQSVFILKHTELSLSDNYVKALFVVLFIAYYIWDTVS